jgi:tetratricopeptide (TPR) repeat protein
MQPIRNTQKEVTLKLRRLIKKENIYIIMLIIFTIFTSVSCQNVAYLDKFGDVDISMGNYDEAIVDYTHAINYKPTDPDGYIGRGYAYQKKGNHQMAIVDYTKAISLEPGDSYLYLVRGLAYSLLGNDQQAIADFSIAITLDPSNAKAYLNRAELYEKLGNNNLSIMDYQRAALLGNDKAKGFLTSKGIGW